MKISKATFVVTDTETTGLSASRDRIIEIGAVRVRGGEVVDRFEQLVNPGTAISRRITRLTGISTGMVFDKPPIGKVLPHYMEFLADGIFVAHNAPFDLRFVNAGLQRHDFDALERSVLCTLRLARRLLPGLRSKGLAALVDFYGINQQNRHRALGDAEATATILCRFLSQLQFEHGVETVSELLGFQRKRYRDVRKAPTHVRKLRRKVSSDIPEEPGVYVLRSSSGDPLYIGKARNLKNRVQSYFTSIESHDAHRQKLVRRVRSITWEKTASELDALILESRLIKENRPKYNRAQRFYRRRPFLKIAINQTYPGISCTYNLEDSAAEYYGPLRGRKEADWLLEIIGRYFLLRECTDREFDRGKRCYLADIERCTAPCENSRPVGDYATSLQHVRAFLAGHADAVLDKLDAAMRKAASEMQFEKAAELRDQQKKVARFARRQACLGPPVFNRDMALLEEQNSGWIVLLVRRGQHVETLLSCESEVNFEDRLGAALDRHFSAGVAEVSALSTKEVHEIRVVAQWIYRRREDIIKVDLSHDDTDGLMNRILERMNGVVEKVT